MNRTPLRVSTALLLTLLLVSAWAGVTSRAIAAPPPRPANQTEVPVDDVINRLDGYFNSAFDGYCFKNWIRMGDIGLVRARLNDSDVEVYIDPAFLDSQDAAAAYVDYSYAGLEYFNDLVLADAPAKVPAQTLWHETMHAIFDAHDDELAAAGITTDEQFTWYMELSLNALTNTLSKYEQELKKADKCDPDKLEKKWALFARQMEDARLSNGYGSAPLTDAQLQLLEKLTGFRVNLAEIERGYKSGGCGECGPVTPTPPVTSDALDLIFCIDVTGSMEDDIASVKAAASNIVNSISAKTDNYRVAIIAYRDWDDTAGYAMFEDYAFSADKGTIIANINRLSVGGGDDEPEAVLEALMRAIDSRSVGGWRNNVNKQIILMGDAPPHNPSREGLTPAIVAQAAWDADPVVIQAVVVGNYGSYSAEAVEAFRDLAERTNGNFFEADDAEAVPEVLQKTIEVIKTAPSSGSNLDTKWLLIGAGAVGGGLLLFGLFLLLLLKLTRGRPPRPMMAQPHPAPRHYPAPPPAGPPVRPPSRAQDRTMVATPMTAAILSVVSGTDVGQRFPLQPSNRIGRAADNDIVLRDGQVSRYHAVISYSEQGYVVADLGSANGTWINGARITRPTPLRPGDSLRMGNDELVLQKFAS